MSRIKKIISIFFVCVWIGMSGVHSHAWVWAHRYLQRSSDLCMSLGTHAHADICSAPVLTSLSPLMTLHCTGWGTVSIWCLLFWLTCWQANCLLLLRQWSSRSAAKATWAFMWGLRVSVIMLVRQIHFPLNHTSSPHSYVLFICLLFYCVCTRYTHVPGCTCGSQKAALEFVLFWLRGLNSGRLCGMHFTCWDS